MSPNGSITFLDRFDVRFFLDRDTPLAYLSVRNESRPVPNPQFNEPGEPRYLDQHVMVYTLVVQYIGQERGILLEFATEDMRDRVRRALRPDDAVETIS